MTKKSKKLPLLMMALGLTSVAAFSPLKADPGHLVCKDNLAFCDAGCTSDSPLSCRTGCFDEYKKCEAELSAFETGGN